MAKVLALATEAPQKPCRTPLGSYHYNEASFEESGHRVQGWKRSAVAPHPNVDLEESASGPAVGS